MSSINHQDLAQSRLITQYTESTNLIGYLRALVSEADVLEQALCDLNDGRTIDTATGAVLDILGELVGQSRLYLLGNEVTYFGYAGAGPNIDGYGDTNNITLGARYLDLFEFQGDPSLQSDPEYRLYIRARIAKNNSKGTINSIISQLLFLFDAELILLTEGTEASFSVAIGTPVPLTIDQRRLITDTDLLPKPAGVRFESTVEFDSNGFFGYAGAAVGVSGYGTGAYASII